MDWQTCPRCKSSKYRNPSLVLMVNVCGHQLCESCVEQLFVRGSGACPQCQKPLKRSGFRAQFFEDAEMDKEVDVRRKVAKELTLRQEDFPSLRDFNDYLEEIESVVFNLINGVDVDGTRKKMDGIKDRFKKELGKSKNRKSKDQELLDKVVAEEKSLGDDVNKRYMQEQVMAERERAKIKDRLLDELQDSEMSAAAVVAIHKRKQGIPDTTGQEVTPLRSISAVRPVIQEPPPLLSASEVEWFRARDVDLLNVEDKLSGPRVPPANALEKAGYLNAVRAAPPAEVAMGFISVFPARRALLSAYDGLFIFPDTSPV
ncbi:CDK-activating kinase assembly factor MAT1-like [Paramacrobiotus metropolitanus]|uniref:CDK-activating kinase assembly factor MAT1-like n=1 Tax=Paramacrobiotus metropolitanus TaxID=2943436 RepID=UPI0024464B84|nr:CDK-activating kinase assembly factor MAT1-like [Paramacrobiotus metropolitanus]